MIFRDARDRDALVERIANATEDAGLECFAWAITGSRLLLCVRTGEMPLSKVMHRVAGGYAQDYNGRYGQRGHLFQNRFRSLVIEPDRYLLDVVRYVHLAPLRLGDVSDVDELARHPWSGYGALMGADGPPFQSIDPVLAKFSDSPVLARARLHAWMLDGANDNEDEWVVARLDGRRHPEPQWNGNGAGSRDARVLGSPVFAAVVLARAHERQRPQLDLESQGWTTDRIIDWVCASLEVDDAGVRNGRRSWTQSRARAVAAFLASTQLGVPAVELALALGVSDSSISRAIARGRRASEEEGLSLR